MQRAPARPAERLVARQAHELGELVLALDASLNRFLAVLVVVLVAALPRVGHHTIAIVADAFAFGVAVAIWYRLLPR